MLICLLAIFLAALAAPWLHRAAGPRVTWALAIVPLAVAAFFIRRVDQIHDGQFFFVSLPWVPQFDIALSFYLDGLGLLFALLITGIGTLVVIYSGGYLAGDERLGEFAGFLFFFMGSMLGLALADNLMTLFLFWELTSVSSYLLIGFNHERPESRSAALQSLLVTGGGGLALLAGLLLLGLAGGTFELSRLLHQGGDLRQHALYVPMLLLILVGAFTKSAQFPFHFWLPSAMAAPTPVSAYLHSATMVNAGVYLLARLNPLLGDTALWFYLIVAVGGATTLVGAYLAFRATDLKRILAYSTISVLGTLTMLLGVGTEMAVKAAMLLLLAHALYKGALFLVAGAVDHVVHQRDIRRLSGLRRVMPVTATVAAVAGLSMAGVLPAFGFIGKELYYDAVGEAAGVAWQLAAVFSNMLLVAVVGLVCVKPFVGPPMEFAPHSREVPLSLWIGPAVLGTLGFLLGMFPQATAQSLVAASTASVTAEPTTVHLALWHGVNSALLLSILTLAGGVALYGVRNRLLFLATLERPLLTYGPARWYQFFLEALNRVALWQTRLLQNGYLRFYLLTIIGTTVALVWGGALRQGLLRRVTLQWSEIRLHEAAVASLILLGALVAVRSRSRLASVAGVGVVGYAVAAMFVLFSAPDLAMTQFVIETLTVILLVLVFYHLPDFRTFSTSSVRWRDALVALIAGGTLTSLLLIAMTIRAHHPVSEYYARQSVQAAHGRNIVNVILVDFRALDTLGEITVLAIAGIGVYALLKLRLACPDAEPRLPSSEPDNRSGSPEAGPGAGEGHVPPTRSAAVTGDKPREISKETPPWIP